MKGIDISEHNSYIDFAKVKQSGIDFVNIRIGWIGNVDNHTIDKYFESYIQNAIRYGLKIGIYVYSYCKSVSAIESGVNWILKILNTKGYKDYITMPIFLDLEDNSILSCGREGLTNQALQFCKLIENNGYKAGIYANKNWFTNYLDINKLISFKIWLAEWSEKSNHTANFRVDLWQYSSKGSVEGITGNVDLNKCLNCQNPPVSTENEEVKGEFNVKLYQNGSTKEVVYQDTECKIQIGYLHPNEQAECYGIINGKALIVYNVDGKNYKKTGFVKWVGGVK